MVGWPHRLRGGDCGLVARRRAPCGEASEGLAAGSCHRVTVRDYPTRGATRPACGYGGRGETRRWPGRLARILPTSKGAELREWGKAEGRGPRMAPRGCGPPLRGPSHRLRVAARYATTSGNASFFVWHGILYVPVPTVPTCQFASGNALFVVLHGIFCLLFPLFPLGIYRH